VVTLFACASGLTYLLIRLTTLGSGSLLVLSLPLLVAEYVAFAQFALFAFAAWNSPRVSESRPVADPPFSVDLVINARLSELADLERTLVGARAMRLLGTVVVVDTSRRVAHRELAGSFGAQYITDPRLDVEPAAAVFDASTSECYLWLDAGQVPLPDLIPAGFARLVDPSVAVWQSAIGLINSDSLVHLQRGRDEEAVLRNVIAPGLDELGAAPWSGPGSNVRREAIDSIGGFAAGGPSEVQRTLVQLHSHDWTSAYDQKPRVRAIAPDDLDDYLVARRRRATGTLGAFASRHSPLTASGLSPTQRFAHLVSASPFFSGIRQLVVVAVVIGALLMGRIPIEGPLAPILAPWIVSMALATLARRLLADGSMRVGDWTRQGWRTLGADVAGILRVLRHKTGAHDTEHHGATGVRTLGRLRLLTGVVIALDVALLLRGATLLNNGLLPRFSVADRVLVISFGLFMLVPMIDVLQLIVSRKQRRKAFRLEVALDAVVGGTHTKTVDLATSGIGVVLPHAPAVGTPLEIVLELPDLAGEEQHISVRGLVRSAVPDPSGRVRVGLEFVDLERSARQALVEFCMIGAARNDAPQHVAEPRSLSIHRPHLHRVHSVRALTAIATAASLVVMLVGPSSASASEESINFGLQVRQTDGSPVHGIAVRYHDGSWQDAPATNADGRTEFGFASQEVQLELLYSDGRLVMPINAGEAELVLARIEAGSSQVDEIDLGGGWTTFVDGAEMLPGRVALRLSDGTVVKTTVDAGHVFDVGTGVQTVVVATGDVDAIEMETIEAPQTTVPETTTVPATTAAPEPSSTTEDEQ